MSALGHKRKYSIRLQHVRFTPESGPHAKPSVCRLSADNGHCHHSRNGRYEYRAASNPSLVYLDVGCSDYLTPLLHFFGNEFAEVGGRERKYNSA
jgi:hypothetical protein